MKARKSGWEALEKANTTMTTLHKATPSNINMQAEMMCNDREGVQCVMQLLREISRKGANALHIASFIFSNLENMRRGYPEISLMLADIDCDKSPAAYMAEIGMMISKLDAYKLDRIETAATYCHELFDKSALDTPLDEFVDDFGE